jgi:hypothetical protein
VVQGQKMIRYYVVPMKYQAPCQAPCQTPARPRVVCRTRVYAKAPVGQAKNDEHQQKTTETAQAKQKDDTFIASGSVKALRSVREKIDAVEDTLRYRLPSIYNHLQAEMSSVVRDGLSDIDVLRQKMSVHEYNAAEQCELLTKLLFELDGIESQGNVGVKNVRKLQVLRIQKLLDEADHLKEQATGLKRHVDQLTEQSSNEDEDLENECPDETSSGMATEVKKLRELVAIMKDQFDEIESKLQEANERIQSLEANRQSVSQSENESTSRLDGVNAVETEIPEPDSEMEPVVGEGKHEAHELHDNGEATDSGSPNNGMPIEIEAIDATENNENAHANSFTRLPISGNQFAVLGDQSDSDSESTSSVSGDNEVPAPSEGNVEVQFEHETNSSQFVTESDDTELVEVTPDNMDSESKRHNEGAEESASITESTIEEHVAIDGLDEGMSAGHGAKEAAESETDFSKDCDDTELVDVDVDSESVPHSKYTKESGSIAEESAMEENVEVVADELDESISASHADESEETEGDDFVVVNSQEK